MRKWIIGLIAAVGLAAIVYGVGALLPRDHVARGEAVVAAPPERVAALIREVEKQPVWRTGLTRVEVRGREDGVLRYVEHGEEEPIAFALSETAPGRAFESRIDDPDLPFSGAWTISLAPSGGATRVSIEERGSVHDPLFRFFSALVFGHEGTIKAYLEDLQREVSRS